jgi:hypothetical protein
MGFLSRFDILSGITQRWACPPMNTYIIFLNEKKKIEIRRGMGP